MHQGNTAPKTFFKLFGSIRGVRYAHETYDFAEKYDLKEIR